MIYLIELLAIPVLVFGTCWLGSLSGARVPGAHRAVSR